jgi:hypothetical protein
MKRLLIPILMSILLGACALIPSASQIPSTKVIEVIRTTVSKEMTQIPSSAAVTFTRSGGLSGKTEQWSFFLDGRVLSSQGTSQLAAGDVAQLVTALTSAGIFDLKESYGGLSNCNDCFTYTISITVDNKTKTITTMEGAPIPAELDTIHGINQRLYQ